MEEIIPLLIPALAAMGAVRLFLLPIRFAWKLVIHCAAGLLCLWLLNAAAPLTGVCVPVNAVTAAAAGFAGLPGMALLALLAAAG